MYLGRCTITRELLFNGDLRIVERQMEELRQRVPRGTVFVVARAQPDSVHYRPGDAVEVLAMEPDDIPRGMASAVRVVARSEGLI